MAGVQAGEASVNGLFSQETNSRAEEAFGIGGETEPPSRLGTADQANAYGGGESAAKRAGAVLSNWAFREGADRVKIPGVGDSNTRTIASDQARDDLVAISYAKNVDSGDKTDHVRSLKRLRPAGSGPFPDAENADDAAGSSKPGTADGRAASA